MFISGKCLHSYGKLLSLIGKSTINGIAMLIYQRVSFMFFIVVLLFLVKRPWITALAGVMPIFASQANICFDCYHPFLKQIPVTVAICVEQIIQTYPLTIENCVNEIMLSQERPTSNEQCSKPQIPIRDYIYICIIHIMSYVYIYIIYRVVSSHVITNQCTKISSQWLPWRYNQPWFLWREDI